jgi:hypothetical protein
MAYHCAFLFVTGIDKYFCTAALILRAQENQWQVLFGAIFNGNGMPYDFVRIIAQEIIRVDITSHNHYALNSFQVLEQSGEAISDLRRELHICSTVTRQLQDQSSAIKQNIHLQSRQAEHFPITTKAQFHPSALLPMVVIFAFSRLKSCSRKRRPSFESSPGWSVVINSRILTN